MRRCSAATKKCPVIETVVEASKSVIPTCVGIHAQSTNRVRRNQTPPVSLIGICSDDSHPVGPRRAWLPNKPAVRCGRRFLSFFLLVALLLIVPFVPNARVAAQETPTTDGADNTTGDVALAALNGRLVQGTAGAPPPNEQPLTLTALVDFQPVESFELTTDAQGEFRAEGLSTDPARTYIVETIYGGVPYRSEPVAPVDGLLPDIEIAIYEPTDDPSGLYISRLNWIVDYEPGRLRFGQIVTFGNRLDRAYVGQPVEGVPRPATTALVLPPGAEEISFQGGILGGRYTQVGDRIYDVAAVPPGEESQQTFMGFVVPYEGSAVRIEQPFLYDVAAANLLATALPDDSAVELAVITPETADAFTFAGTENVQGSSFLLWTGADLAPQTVVLDFKGLIPIDGRDPREQAAFAAPNIPVAAPWLLGGALAAGLAGMLVWALRQQPAGGGSPPQTLAAERDALVQQIAQLDDQHAIGTIPNERWAYERARLKGRLLAVAGRLAEGDVSEQS